MGVGMAGGLGASQSIPWGLGLGSHGIPNKRSSRWGRHHRGSRLLQQPG